MVGGKNLKSKRHMRWMYHRGVLVPIICFTQGEKGLPEAVKLSEYTEGDLLRAFRRASYNLGQTEITSQ